jgi:hypothetical protein
LRFITDDGEPGFNADLRELEGFHGVADSAVETDTQAANIQHVAPVAKHLESEFAGGDEENHFFSAVSFEKFEKLFTDIMNRRNKKDFRIFRGEGMDRFPNEALPADRMIGIVDALICESTGRTFERFMAIGKTDNEERGIQRFLKLFYTGKSIEEKIAIAQMGVFSGIRFKEIPRIFEGMFEKIVAKKVIFIMAQEIDKTFPAEKTGSFLSNAWNSGKVPDGLQRRQGFCFLIPSSFCAFPRRVRIPNF